MVSFNPKNMSKLCKDVVPQPKAVKTAEELAIEARELEMVPKYLELASFQGHDRFNPEQIKGLAKSFKIYETGLSKTELVKELLAIGTEKGKPLTSKEITGFLHATSSMKMLEQRNVLKFLKAAKETEIEKVTPENIRKIYPYEDFKKREIARVEKYKWYTNDPNYTKEENLRSRYETLLNNELRLESNKYYSNARKVNKKPVSEYITGNDVRFVRAVAKSKDPETLLVIVSNTGVHDVISASAEALVDAYKLSGGSLNLVLDLSRGFYPAETKQIVEILRKEADKGMERDWSRYFGQTVSNYLDNTLGGPNLSSQRSAVLKELGLTGKVKLIPLGKYADAYPASPLLGRGSRIADGNYEGGKRK